MNCNKYYCVWEGWCLHVSPTREGLHCMLTCLHIVVLTEEQLTKLPSKAEVVYHEH